MPIIGPGVGGSFTWGPEGPAIPPQELILMVEGLAGGSVTLSLTGTDASGVLICQDDVRITIIDLDVQWYTWVNGQPDTLIADPNLPVVNEQGVPVPGSPANVGVRYFPDATNPGEGWNKDVGVVVQTIPAVGGVPVLLKALDVDDPSDNMPPVDANAFDGDDNRAKKVSQFRAVGGRQLGVLAGLPWRGRRESPGSGRSGDAVEPARDSAEWSGDSRDRRHRAGMWFLREPLGRDSCP